MLLVARARNSMVGFDPFPTIAVIGTVATSPTAGQCISIIPLCRHGDLYAVSSVTSLSRPNISAIKYALTYMNARRR